MVGSGSHSTSNWCHTPLHQLSLFACIWEPSLVGINVSRYKIIDGSNFICDTILAYFFHKCTLSSLHMWHILAIEGHISCWHIFCINVVNKCWEFIDLWWICLVMWGLQIDYIICAVGHTCVMSQAYLFRSICQ